MKVSVLQESDLGYHTIEAVSWPYRILVFIYPEKGKVVEEILEQELKRPDGKKGEPKNSITVKTKTLKKCKRRYKN